MANIDILGKQPCILQTHLKSHSGEKSNTNLHVVVGQGASQTVASNTVALILLLTKGPADKFRCRFDPFF